MMEKLKSITTVIGLIGGLMMMGTVIGSFASAVLFWEDVKRVMATVNETDVRYYHEKLVPQHQELWQNKHH